MTLSAECVSVDKAPRGGVYFKGKTKEGKSVERQGRKAIGPAARNEYGCQLYRLLFITTARQAEACLFNLKLLNRQTTK